MVSFNLKDIVKPSINEIEKYIPGESLSTNSKEKISKLSSNESPFKIPRKVINKVKVTENDKAMQETMESTVRSKTPLARPEMPNRPGHNSNIRDKAMYSYDFYKYRYKKDFR